MQKIRLFLLISGTFLFTFSSAQTFNTTASVGGPGWYRVAQLGQLRGQNTVTVYTIGGDYAPRSTTIRWWHDWCATAGLNIISEYGDNYFWSAARITDDGTTNSYLEIYFNTQITSLFLSMLYEGGQACGSLYTGQLSSGGSTVRASTSTGPFSINGKLIINPDGNLGIGTLSPQKKLDLNNGNTGGQIASFGSQIGNNDWSGIHIGFSEPANNLYRKAGIAFERTDVHARGKLHFINDIEPGSSSYDLADTKMVISDNGYVGIGTVNPSQKLDVAGIIRANEIIVNTGGADFVLSQDYDLKQISEVEQYIRKYNRLPGIPSASEMQEKGMSVSEMQTKLLQKIEELTLYIIDQQKEIESLKSEINGLKEH